MPATPESIIKFSFGPEGLKEAEGALKGMEGTVGRIGGLFEHMAGKIGALAGITGLAKVVSDFARIEQSATRTALAVNNITGGRQMTAAAYAITRATGIDEQDALAGMNASQAFLGGSFLSDTQNARAYGMFMAHASQATGMSSGALGTFLGQTLGLQNRQLNMGTTQGVIGGLYGEAKAAGMAGQFDQFSQVVNAMQQSSGVLHPQRGQQAIYGAFYGALARRDRAFRDPSTAASALGSIDSVLGDAYANPRMQAFLQMAGVGINEQMNPLSHPDALRKIKAQADMQFGKGSTLESLALRSQFGEAGARAIMAGVTAGDVRREMHARHGGAGDMHARAQAMEKTLASRLQELQAAIEQKLLPVTERIADALGALTGSNPAIDAGIGAVAGLGAWRGARRLRRHFGKSAAGEAEHAGQAARGTEGIWRDAMPEKAVSKFGRVKSFLGKDLGTLAGEGALRGALGKLLGPEAIVAQEMFFPDGWFQNLTGGDLSDNSWVKPETMGLRKKLKHMTPQAGIHYLQGRLKHYAQEGRGDDQTMQMVLILSQMLAEIRKLNKPGSGGQPGMKGASFSDTMTARNQMTAFEMGVMGHGGSGSGSSQFVSYVTGGGDPRPFSGGGSGGGSGGHHSAGTSTPGGGKAPAAFVKAANAAARATGIHAAILLGLADVETGGSFATDQTSHAGAQGPAQFLQGTWDAYGDGHPADVWKVGPALHGAAKYLVALGGLHDIRTALAKYNGGPRNPQYRYADEVIKRARKYGYNASSKPAKKSHKHSGGGSPGGSGGSSPAGGSPVNAVSSSAGGGDFGGMALGGGFPASSGGGTLAVTVNVDGRRLEHHRRRTRSL